MQDEALKFRPVFPDEIAVTGLDADGLQDAARQTLLAVILTLKHTEHHILNMITEAEEKGGCDYFQCETGEQRAVTLDVDTWLMLQDMLSDTTQRATKLYEAIYKRGIY